MTVEGTLKELNYYSFQMHEKGRGKAFFYLFTECYLQVETRTHSSFCYYLALIILTRIRLVVNECDTLRSL